MNKRSRELLASTAVVGVTAVCLAVSLRSEPIRVISVPSSIHIEEKPTSGPITLTQSPVPTKVIIPTCTPIPTAVPTVTPTPIATMSPTPTVAPTSAVGGVMITGQTEFKSYERYTAITRKSSDQYKLQQIAYTGDYGIRMVDGRYCVALGSRWSVTIGEKLDVYMEDGTVIPVILGDCKQDRHTDATNSWGLDNGDVLEFIVDEDMIPDLVRKTGSLNCIFAGKVSNIVKVE